MGSNGLTSQIVVRVDDQMRQALESGARANERTLAQQVRYLLRERLGLAVAPNA